MISPRPFVIFSLPRSRTAWLRHYLGAGGQFKVGHDIAVYCDKAEDFLAAYRDGMVGTVETGAVIAWRLLKEALPDVKMICVHRPLAEVRASLARFGIEAEAELAERQAIMDSLLRVRGVEHIDFDSLRSWQCCKWLFEHCHEVDWNPEWYNSCARVNIQVDMTQRLVELANRYDAMLTLKAEIYSRSSELVSCRELN